MATASLVLGIIALVIVFIPIIGFIAWICAPLGLIFGGIAMGKPVGRGAAIAGLICSGLALIVALLWAFFFMAAMSTAAAV